ncbi:hypothetical protein GW17_00024334 [Ensete ventricosum]|nr:hypothetical protein GW17_00024334 [Ensete ventricosum]
MHPLRFPNGSIRAKVFVRKISFKLRVMRLNRVELFYALVAAKVGAACGGGAATCMLSACRGGWPQSGPLQGRLTMAWLPARGYRLRPGPLQGAATCGHDRLRPTRRGDRLRSAR